MDYSASPEDFNKLWRIPDGHKSQQLFSVGGGHEPARTVGSGSSRRLAGKRHHGKGVIEDSREGKMENTPSGTYAVYTSQSFRGISMASKDDILPNSHQRGYTVQNIHGELPLCKKHVGHAVVEKATTRSD